MHLPALRLRPCSSYTERLSPFLRHAVQAARHHPQLAEDVGQSYPPPQACPAAVCCHSFSTLLAREHCFRLLFLQEQLEKYPDLQLYAAMTTARPL